MSTLISKLAVFGLAMLGGFAFTYYIMFLTDVDVYLPESIEEFKESDGRNCVQTVFKGIKSMKGDGAEDVRASDEKLGESGNTKSCVIINWRRWTPKEKEHQTKRKGSLKFLWAAARGNTGFVVFTKAEPVKEGSSNRMKFEGVAYVVSKDNGKWRISKKIKEEVKDKKVDESKFPKFDVFDEIEKKRMLNRADVDKAMDFTKFSDLCTGTECGSEFESPLDVSVYLWWRNTNVEPDRMSSVISNLGEWWKEVFGDTDWNMKEVAQNVSGHWSRSNTRGIRWQRVRRWSRNSYYYDDD